MALETITKDVATEVLGHAWEDQGFYAGWVAQTYYYVRHTTRFLALAAARCSWDEGAIHERLLDNAAEEQGHELLLLADLAALGESLKEHPELATTTTFIDALYRHIEADGAIAVFGRLLLLEGLAVEAGAELHRRVAVKHGPSAANFLRVHSEEDPGHLAKAIQSIRSMSDERQAVVDRVLVESVATYSSMLAQIAK